MLRVSAFGGIQQLGNWVKKLATPLTRLFQWIAEGQKKQPVCRT
jgi:hypothetical protein